jgi:hypothetical protein
VKILLLSSCFGLLALSASASPPSCKTVEKDGNTFDTCERRDTECYSKLAAEQTKSPSTQWNGCAWPAIITKTHFTAVGLIFYTTHVTLVPSYRDSERMDVTISIEKYDHTIQTYERKDVPIIIRDDIPRATVDFGTQFEPIGVPTVDATEKGGAREVSHSYR